MLGMMEGANARRAAGVLAALLGVLPARVALAEDVAAPRTTEESPAARRQSVSRADDDEASDPATDTESQGLNASRLAALRRERAQIHRGGPITLLAVGGGVGVISLGLAQMQGLSAMSDSSTPPPRSSPTGLYVASGVGFTAAVIGLLWLIDCNQRRGDLEDRIDRLGGRSARSFVGDLRPPGHQHL